MEITRLRLRVAAGAKRPGAVGRHGDAWKVRVAPPPEGGRANAAVVRLLSGAVCVPVDAVTVVSGNGGRDKIVELAGIDPSLTDWRMSSAAGKEQP